jgi:predicted lipid-binding transport protein (Tim44 family)
MANMLMFGLLAMAVIGIIGFVMRKRAAAAASGSASGNGNGFQYAGAAAVNTATPDAPASRVHEVSMPRTAADNGTASAASTHNGSGSMIGSAIGAGVGSAVGGAVGSVASSPMTAAIPADFDTAGFERSAKVQFIRLQAANDAADLSDIREFTTPEMYAELSMDITERGSAAQHTEVISVTAQVLEVVEEAQRYVASVRFAGQVRESTGAAAEAFDEIWHLTKPRTSPGGWLLAGIQQPQA